MKRLISVCVAGLSASLLISLIFALTSSAGAETKAAASAFTPNAEEPLAIALAYIHASREALGLSRAGVDGLLVKDHYLSRKSGITHIYFIQTHDGIEVYNAILNINIAANGRVLNAGNRTIPNLTAVIQTSERQLTAVDALAKAAAHLGLPLRQPPALLRVEGGADQAALIGDGGIAREPIPARLVYQPLANGTVRLAWELTIYELSGHNWWQVRVDAADGRVLDKNNLIIHDDWGDLQTQAAGEAIAHNHHHAVQIAASTVPSGYLVYALPVESPHFTTPLPPADARTTAVAPWLNAPSASPLGWHATSTTNWTNTQGNNVDAHKDALRFDCGPMLECDSPLDLTVEPTTPDNVNAAIINLFYWNNIIHDVTYEHGFDEAAGNFQTDNFGLGGLGNDRVNAIAQGPGTCGASFSTPPDGNPPSMNILICGLASPSRDGDLDDLVIVHEFGHGVSLRLTGGPATTSCLSNAEQPGEGWSDWLGLMVTMEVGDTATDDRTIGTWLFGQGPSGPGIRTFPYTADMAVNPHTYNDIITAPSPHAVGEVWATMLWDVVWALVHAHGFNPDFYGDWSSGGNNLALQLVLDGMKLQPCGPGFVDARDSILVADQALTGGANQCLIWGAFARRGLGFSADQGSPNSTSDGTEAFDVPGFCDLLSASPANQDICAGEAAEYAVTVGAGFTPDIILEAAGHPTGTTAVFSPNPVTAVPGTATLTIANTAGATGGDYTITITGTDAVSMPASYQVGLSLIGVLPGAVSLLAPADGATDVDRQLTLAWTAVPQAASYLLALDDDADFSSPVYTATVGSTAHTAVLPLTSLTTYYWRVTAANLCGNGPPSPIFSFTTEEIPSLLLVDDDDDNPDVRGYYTATLDALGLAYDIWNTANSDNEPDLEFLAPHDAIIWFTGAEYGGFAGPGAAGEAALGIWLDAGNCLFISSQDYLYDRGQTPFMSDYLGVGTGSSDNGNYASVTGQGTVFGGLGPYPLVYPFSDFSDIISPSPSAMLAFDGDNGNDAAVNKAGNLYRTVFLGFPWEAIGNADERLELLQTALAWCDDDGSTGTLAGTVADDGTGQGIDGATVTADDGADTQTAITGGNGHYEIDLEPGIYTVTAVATGYISATVTAVQIITSSVTTVDFSLTEAVATLERDEDMIAATVVVGHSVTRTLTISNSGTISFDFTAVPGAAWAEVTPPGGTLAPGQSMVLSLTFDSASTAGPGAYTTALTFNGSFDNAPLPVDLLLTVMPAAEPGWQIYLPLMRH